MRTYRGCHDVLGAPDNARLRDSIEHSGLFVWSFDRPALTARSS
jgi:hypothetical protein